MEILKPKHKLWECLKCGVVTITPKEHFMKCHNTKNLHHICYLMTFNDVSRWPISPKAKAFLDSMPETPPDLNYWKG